jgi:hypothetical protein
MGDVDELISEAGRTHVIPPREDPALLERLRDPEVLGRARELLGSRDPSERGKAILCIERIGYVLHDQETAALLLDHAGSTKDKYEVMKTLDALKGCTPPRPLPAEPLLRLARRPQWQVWQAAVQCLHLADPDDVEPALLERLDADREGLAYVTRELRFMRSAASLEALEKLLGHESLDVRCIALDSLGERLGEGVVPHARRLAAGRHHQEKWWAQKWLARFGDADDVPFMASRVKALLSSKRQRQYDPPELSYVVDFLLRHEEVPDAKTALDLLRKRADRLPENERAWLRKHAPQVLDIGA